MKDFRQSLLIKLPGKSKLICEFSQISYYTFKEYCLKFLSPTCVQVTAALPHCLPSTAEQHNHTGYNFPLGQLETWIYQTYPLQNQHQKTNTRRLSQSSKSLFKGNCIINASKTSATHKLLCQ